jgi:hypothetical protein
VNFKMLLNQIEKMAIQERYSADVQKDMNQVELSNRFRICCENNHHLLGIEPDLQRNLEGHLAKCIRSWKKRGMNVRHLEEKMGMVEPLDFLN